MKYFINLFALIFLLSLIISCGKSNKNESDNDNSEKKEIKSAGEIKIVLLEMKEKIGKGLSQQKMRWYSYYVENYYDSDETYEKIKIVCNDLPLDSNSGAFTIAYFFKDKVNAPKLQADGGWKSIESQNSWYDKLSKYCVGYFEISKNDTNFSKKWSQ
jgi:hypothetical protein